MKQENQEKSTPLMRQYNQIKEKYPETILLYRLGDFFETFENDAVITAKVCGITLTKRNNGYGADMPLAGFPHHQLDTYLPKLVRAGYRVAVCEQLEDPKQAKGIVKRGVVEVVTPGVALYDKLLESAKNNYVVAVAAQKEIEPGSVIGIAFADISTGEFFAAELYARALSEILSSVNPSEIVLDKRYREFIDQKTGSLAAKPRITRLEEWIFDESFTGELLNNHFKTHSLKGFGIESLALGKRAAGALLHYISETRGGIPEHIRKISLYEPNEYMTLDPATRRNLEIIYSSGDTKDGSLISILDKTVTPMGSRLFKRWLTMPLKSKDKAQERLNSTDYFYNSAEKRSTLRETLQHTGDMERLSARITSGRTNARDAAALRDGLKAVPQLKNLLANAEDELIAALAKNLTDPEELTAFLENALLDDPSTVIGSGNIFRRGFNAELDDYLDAKHKGKSWIADYQEQERRETGIPSLKVSFNNVFGYYIEITKTHAEKAPNHYERRQTLTNAERYITPKLKEFEEKILNAEERIRELETVLFENVRNEIARYLDIIQQNSFLIAQIDCLASLAQVAAEYGYIKPELTDEPLLEIVDGRHPVVERLLPVGQSFTPNSSVMNPEDSFLHVITGLNMSGKSCYLRQTGLIILLAQIGSYVPAKSARIGIADRIFTRVGASDNMSQGESTFLVEMQEAANILNNATDKSLILLDEVGRGTATFDGISIAWSIAEYIHNRIGARTLFATHYHELTELEEKYAGIKNHKVQVIETGDNIIFSHKVVEGKSDYSFGIHVAKMAGMPYDVVERADEIMKTLESQDDDNAINASKPDIKSIKTKKARFDTDQLAIFEFRDDYLRERISQIKIDNVTPIQALNLLAELCREAKK